MRSLIITVVLFMAAGAAVCSGADCDVVPIKEWGLEESLRKDVLPNPVDWVVIQHTVTPEYNDDIGCEKILRAMRRYTREIFKYDDIAQSFLICGNGKVYEGAGWERVGAHTRGYNRKSIGISFIGDFDSKLPTDRALSAAINLLDCGVKNNHLTSSYKLVGHRQLSNTVSPGDVLQKEIENWPHWSNV